MGRQWLGRILMTGDEILGAVTIAVIAVWVVLCLRSKELWDSLLMLWDSLLMLLAIVLVPVFLFGLVYTVINVWAAPVTLGPLIIMAMLWKR
jgi:hypothetical protein